MGTRDIVGPRRGALVPDDDERAFAAEVARLIGDPALRKALSREARDYAREWHADALARRMADLYAEVIAAGDAPTPSRAAIVA